MGFSVGLKGLLLVAVVAIAPAPAQALEDPAAGLQLNPQTYRSLLGSPPAPGSPQEAEDLAILRWNQRTRSPQAVQHAWQFLNRYLGVFNSAVGANLAKTAPTLWQGLPAFLREADRVKDALKDHYQRPRPFVTHGDLQPCLPLETSHSFPSGHSTWYATASRLLADLLPQRRERLLSTGLQGGSARVYCQVHYPSDVLAAQRLATALSAEIIASPQWQAFRARLQPELLKLLQQPPAGLPLLSD